jgi:hypothetical protein
MYLHMNTHAKGSKNLPAHAEEGGRLTLATSRPARRDTWVSGEDERLRTLPWSPQVRFKWLQV